VRPESDNVWTPCRSSMMPTGINNMPARTLKRRGEQKIHVRLLEFQLTCVFEPLDEGVLQLQLATKRRRIAKAVREQQHEPVSGKS
jgi:hypothetical protein